MPPHLQRRLRPLRAATAAGAGFTLLELMVVIAIIALITQVVIFNMGALIPSTVLDGEAKQLMSNIDYVRSEARLSGKSFKLDLDLTNQRWRIVLPPEDRLASDQTIEENLPLEWRRVDERVRIVSVQQAGGDVMRQNIVPITFDENGCTADQTITFQLKQDEQMIWTVYVRGLTGQTDLKTTVHGRVAPFEPVQEFQF